jgi:xanthine dehydrogenase molybdenum-binding subunit
VDDIYEKNMLHAKVFRSTIANGCVKNIDISKVKALPGIEPL